MAIVTLGFGGETTTLCADVLAGAALLCGFDVTIDVGGWATGVAGGAATAAGAVGSAWAGCLGAATW